MRRYFISLYYSIFFYFDAMEIFLGGEGMGGRKELGTLLLFNPLCSRPRRGTGKLCKTNLQVLSATCASDYYHSMRLIMLENLFRYFYFKNMNAY